MNNTVQNQYVGTREQRGAVWLTANGSNEIASVSVGTSPADGGSTAYRQIVEGTVLAKRNDLGLHYPCASDTVQSTVTSANMVPVADVLQFEIGQYVELETLSADASRFRKVTAIDYATNELTLDGAAFSLTTGDALNVDSGRSRSQAAGGLTASATLVLDAGEGSKFEVGDTLEFVGDTSRTITAIATDTLTLSAVVTIADNSQIVSNSDAQYKITNKTVTIDHFELIPQNVLIPTRPIGRVKEILVVGLTDAIKTALAGRIIFDQRTIA